jgi:hypothetical protein
MADAAKTKKPVSVGLFGNARGELIARVNVLTEGRRFADGFFLFVWAFFAATGDVSAFGGEDPISSQRD